MQPYKVWLFSDLIKKDRRVFKVPVYQRNYDWSNIHCEKLYQDIMTATKRNHKHFMGTVVYIVGLGGSTLNEVLIIDGQQRITSLYILLKALYDAAKGVSDEIADELEKVMFNSDCDEKYKLKLKPVKTDNEQLLLLIKDNIDDMDRNSNIYKNYITFKNLIASSEASGCQLNDILNGIKKLEMVEIVLDKSQGDEPQKIFESINSTGLDLSLADIIRNYLLMDDANQDALYENYWTVIEKNVGYRNLGDFVINFLNSQISKSVNSQNAYRLFKEQCEENNLSHEDVLKELKRTSKYYGAFIGENHYYSKRITYCLRAFYTIKQTTVLPFLFKIFSDYENGIIDETTLCKVLDYLLAYLVRTTACEFNKSLSKFMKSLYDRIFAENYDHYYEKIVIFLNDLKANYRMPTDDEFKEALIYKPLYKKPICKFVLSAIENSTKEHIDVSNYTVEHILPQKENAAVWKKEVGDEYGKVYEIYLHTLGNLTITGYNSELGTKSFQDKKAIIREYSKANILNKEVLSAEKWDGVSIQNRAEILADILMRIFHYVDLHSDVSEADALSFGVDSDITVYRTKPVGFSFAGEYTKVSSWVDLLTKFIRLAYDLNTEIISDLAAKNHCISNADKTYLSNDERKLRRARQIDNSGIFFETNLSSKNIISFIKDLLLKMNMDTDEFSFALSEAVFDINDESTWAEGMLPVAKLFYNLMEELVLKSKITISEVEKLKTKDYTKNIFPKADYPAVANNRMDNRGGSPHIRYRAKKLNFNGSDIYISTQFYESDRDFVIKWYKEHLR